MDFDLSQVFSCGDECGKLELMEAAFNLLATNSHLEEKQIPTTNFAWDPEKS